MILFVTYTALAEPLGQSQVLPYLIGLAARGQRMGVVSFEKSGAPSPLRDSTSRKLFDAGVPWLQLVYHQRPRLAATLYDLMRGLHSSLYPRFSAVRLVHARSHVPALIAESLRALRGTPYVFDHRGLMAEEYADAGLWRRGGWTYRVVNRLEERFIRNAAGVVVLTDRYRQELRGAGPMAVIPCAVDLERFKPAREATARFDLVYAGSWSGLYLAEETVLFFESFRRMRPEARFLLLVPPSQPLPTLGDGIVTRHAQPAEVPGLLREARAGISLRQPGRAQIAASPVKVSEYLATGLPVVTSPGVGDLDEVFRETRTGVTITHFNESGRVAAAHALLELLEQGDAIRARCRRVAKERYGLTHAVNAYDGLYRSILGDKSGVR